MVEQTDTAMGAEVDLGVLEIHWALAARAHILGQTLQRHVIAQLLTALLFGQGLLQLLFFQIAVERQNGIAPQQYRHQNAYDIVHIAAVVGQIRHQLDKEGEQRKKDKTPDKWPPGALALLGEQPARHAQQGQGDGQAEQKHAQLAGSHGGFVLRIGLLAQIAHLRLGVGDCLIGLQMGLGLFLALLAGLVLSLLELVQRLAACDQLGVLLGALCRTAGRHPVVKGVARRLVARTLGVELELSPVQCLLGHAGRLLGLVDFGPHTLCIGLRNKGLHLQRAIRLRQIAHHQPTQTDQEEGKHQRHQPEAAAKPFLGQTQRLAHFQLLQKRSAMRILSKALKPKRLKLTARYARPMPVACAATTGSRSPPSPSRCGWQSAFHSDDRQTRYWQPSCARPVARTPG